MKPALWIPCYNEGTRSASVKEAWWWPIPAHNHLLRWTLELLREKIRAGIFSHIIITNDGCNDDTIDWLESFMASENDIPKSLFHILWEWWRANNQGKLRRFFEASQYIHGKLKMSRLVITDADMVHPGGDTFDKLCATHFLSPMQISFQWEWFKWKSYIFSWSGTSGTRSLHIPTMQRTFQDKWITEGLFEKWCGFGLESLLNRTLNYTMTRELTECTEHNTPLFLAPLRRGSYYQEREIMKTEKILDDMGVS